MHPGYIYCRIIVVMVPLCRCLVLFFVNDVWIRNLFLDFYVLP